MKNFKNLKKIVTCVLIVSFSAVIISGCGKASTTTTASASTSNKTNKSKNFAQNSEQMKQRMQDNIKSLVTDGTITQDQADKIITALTSNMQNFGQRNGNGSYSGNKGGNTNKSGSSNNGSSRPKNRPTGTNSENSQNGSGTNNGSGRNWQNNGQRPNPLASLVSDGTITQKQADAVMQKIYGNFGRNRNDQNGQNNNTDQNNPSDQNSNNSSDPNSTTDDQTQSST